MQDNNAQHHTHLSKPVIYQVFTRLFGNKVERNIPWGTAAENGVGKFADFSDKALSEINALGCSHIWFTGVLHHAMVADYRHIGIGNDHPAVVKGRAGSPYAVKDYYNVNPDLALDPENRLEEFKALIARSHRAGLKVIIDIVPNHVARNYQSTAAPVGVEDFGAGDDTGCAYHRDNNFYYLPEEAFSVPELADEFRPLGGEAHPDLATPYHEFPAKWTGNGARKARPDQDDWYETAKLNFGIRPDGQKDFDLLPEGFDALDHTRHADFWYGKNVPNTWRKFRAIAEYWLALGVDGFRYDMAEMVPVEFWSYLNSSIKEINPEALLMAEVYQPDLYRPYIEQGKMDLLYDKVDLYDSLKDIMQGKADTSAILDVEQRLEGLQPNLLRFLENHDEQRLASPKFAGDAEWGRPAMLVTATLAASPVMVYFGQETGEPADSNMGFGHASRTSIFDYCGVPSHQRWMNNGKFDGGALDGRESALRNYYCRLLNFVNRAPALQAEYRDLHQFNCIHSDGYTSPLFAYARFDRQQKLLVVTNFSKEDKGTQTLVLPQDLVAEWQLEDGEYRLNDRLSDKVFTLVVSGGNAVFPLPLAPLASLLLELDN